VGGALDEVKHRDGAMCVSRSVRSGGRRPVRRTVPVAWKGDGALAKTQEISR
jgi:hypothetical protein